MGIMGKKIETIMMGYIGCIGLMEKQMESTIMGYIRVI